MSGYCGTFFYINLCESTFKFLSEILKKCLDQDHAINGYSNTLYEDT